ncbi:AbrB/MazE/SpoVT family DNA-binding domain-containing protein [Azomonas macrocytogenes]|uniref:Bifunctional DNA-binding transcriptional regulator/antitoxin component of YhaV-PrlF toxin-antitoxin module n=1 Tax=Azomonas macrocytogenes TaxID=69962 RepID=A0A839T9W6_AZOMA|nr:AbrB/MazE/SpoVT family DNA-binding domain-containing protein [Azomonas macrocytogenes]MBB3105246.1 bifunctional DNA-binding transcriptional regulator/antitoxin component of YhaV-PrlF toxin-antitoxin module [Azomonas macrocytogenes]
MATLIITREGQVTLGSDLFQHLGIQPGETIEVDKLPDGRLELKAARLHHTRSLAAREAALAQGWQTLRAREQEVLQTLAEMFARVHLAEQRATDAEARKQRAYGGFERLRRKQQREQNQNARLLAD